MTDQLSPSNRSDAQDAWGDYIPPEDRKQAVQRPGRKGIRVLRQRVIQEDRDHCALCHLPMEELESSIDHIIPLSRQGTNAPENLQLVHARPCNEVKGNAVTDKEQLSELYRAHRRLYTSHQTLLKNIRRSTKKKQECCCQWGAAQKDEWPEFECKACPVHKGGMATANEYCKRHRRLKDQVMSEQETSQEKEFSLDAILALFFELATPLGAFQEYVDLVVYMVTPAHRHASFHQASRVCRLALQRTLPWLDMVESPVELEAGAELGAWLDEQKLHYGQTCKVHPLTEGSAEWELLVASTRKEAP